MGMDHYGAGHYWSIEIEPNNLRSKFINNAY